MRRRIIICLSSLLALCLIAGVTAIWCLYESTQQLTGIADAHLIQSMRADMASNAARIESNLLAYLDGHRDGFGSVQAAGERFQESHRRCAGCHHEPDVQAEFDAMNAAFVKYKAAAADMVAADATKPGRPEAPPRHSPAEQHLEALAADVTRHAAGLADRAASHLPSRDSDHSAGVRTAWGVLLGTLAAAMLVGGFVAFHLERHLTRPVASLLEGIEHARNGDVHDHFTFEADAEFRTLAKAFESAYTGLDAAHAGIAQAEKMAAVGRLATGVAHEVGNPLASISAIMQVMRRQSSSDVSKEQVDVVMAEIGRISRVIRELLAFARPAGTPERQRVDIGALLDRATSLLAYDKRAVDMRLDLDREHLPRIPGDADQLLTVFTNIVLNAFDAVRSRAENHGAVKITGGCEGDDVVLRFEDNGPGMSEQQLAMAFEPFFTTKEVGEGTGLGLWISYRVIQQHGGDIELTSRLGEGTTVAVKLPWRRPHQAQYAGTGDGI